MFFSDDMKELVMLMQKHDEFADVKDMHCMFFQTQLTTGDSATIYSAEISEKTTSQTHTVKGSSPI